MESCAPVSYLCWRVFFERRGGLPIRCCPTEQKSRQPNGHSDLADEGVHKSQPMAAPHMFGNVWQSTADWYKKRYEGDGSETDPQGPPGGEFRVLQGDTWIEASSLVRSSNRGWRQPSARHGEYGFRWAGEIRVP